MRAVDLFRKAGHLIGDVPRIPLKHIYRKYRDHTMIKQETYVRNLALAKLCKRIPGSVVECGVWKGGMSAGLSEVTGKERHYYLFDSFEGCPTAKAIDGTKARQWQAAKDSPLFYNNSCADIGFSEEIMEKSGATKYTIVKGWFENTLPGFRAEGGIALLRLDGDWYESTMTCLNYLYPQVNLGGIVIVDDYYSFEGCAKAVHDYLSCHKLGHRIRQFENDVAYVLVKSEA